MDRDTLFYRLMIGAFIIALLLGAGMTVVVVFSDSPTTQQRAIGALMSFLQMAFAFASGYLFGQRNGKD